MLGARQPLVLKVLLVDGKSSSRLQTAEQLRDAGNQVKSVRTTAEALQVLAACEAPAFDVILKAHAPGRRGSNAPRLLRRIGRSQHFRATPVIVTSDSDDQALVAQCLVLGAADFLCKPLRHNELRNLWTRVWWWRRTAAQLLQPGGPSPPDDGYGFGLPGTSQPSSSSDSMETKCDDGDEPTSKEGSVPDGAQQPDADGSRDGNGTSRIAADTLDAHFCTVWKIVRPAGAASPPCCVEANRPASSKLLPSTPERPPTSAHWNTALNPAAARPHGGARAVCFAPRRRRHAPRGCKPCSHLYAGDCATSRAETRPPPHVGRRPCRR